MVSPKRAHCSQLTWNKTNNNKIKIYICQSKFSALLEQKSEQKSAEIFIFPISST